MELEQLIRLRCETTNNEWGKRGMQSIARRIELVTTTDRCSTTHDRPYAELWMGTHPSLPSQDFATGRSLREIVEENPVLLTKAIIQKFGNQLPFLFKVLSIGKALSIQAHPDRKLARQLHAKDSVTYPDTYHKPEMVIALTRFEALYGFRPITELSELLYRIPPFQELVGNEATHYVDLSKKLAEAGKEDPELSRVAIKQAFKAVLEADSEKVKASTRHLIRFAKERMVTGTETSGFISQKLAELIIQLSAQHPDDIGLFIMLFMGHVELEAGEAMFVQSGELHAYLSGDILECMVSSANVLRAGFTTKFRDLDTIMAALRFTPQPPRRIFPFPENNVQISDPVQPVLSFCVLYNPPVEEFGVAKISLGRKGGRAIFDIACSPSILICMEGRGTLTVGEKVEDAAFGFIFFLGHGLRATLESRSCEPFVCYRAFCDLAE